MIFAAVIFEHFGWGDVLLLSLLGFLLGLATKLGPRMRFFEITAAQHPELVRTSQSAGGPAFDLVDGAYKAGAPFFAYVAKGGNHERLHQGFDHAAVA